MPTNWITLTGADIGKVLTAKAEEAVNENLGDDVEIGSELNLDAANRRNALVTLAIRRVRAAILNGNRVPISYTADTVPPEAEIHTLMLAAMPLVQSTPSLAKEFLVGQDGRKTSFERMYDRAEQFLIDIGKGFNVTEPTDPIGEDGVNAESDVNPVFEAVRIGSVDNVDTADLITQGPLSTDETDSVQVTTPLTGDTLIDHTSGLLPLVVVSIASLGLTVAPSGIAPRVVAPVGQDVFDCVLLAGWSATSFSVRLLGVPTVAGYRIAFTLYR